MLGFAVSEFRAKREALGREERPTHPRLINGVVEFSLHGDLAVGVGVHQGQAEVGVIATSGEQTVKKKEVVSLRLGDTLRYLRGTVSAT